MQQMSLENIGHLGMGKTTNNVNVYRKHMEQSKDLVSCEANILHLGKISKISGISGLSCINWYCDGYVA